MSFSVIYKDDDILVVNKPAGIVVHPDAHHKTGTLTQEIIKKYPEIGNIGEDPARPGIVHRLDKDTSGLLLVARNQNAFSHLKKKFQTRSIKKTYLVLVIGRVKNDRGVIELPIGRSRKAPLKRVSGRNLKGKKREAITEYRVLERFKGLAESTAEGFTLLEVMPLTGRTHQIRSHFAAIGHPVVCDQIYAGKRYICPVELDRQFLHAWKLEFTSPSRTKLMLEADLPEDLDQVLKFLRRSVAS